METHVYHCLDGNHILGLVKTSLLLLACATVYWYPHVEGFLNTCVSIVCFGLVVVLAPAGCTVARFLTSEFQCTFRIVVLFNWLLPPQPLSYMLPWLLASYMCIMYQHCKSFLVEFLSIPLTPICVFLLLGNRVR